MSTATKPKHIGRQISRIRELKDMKQEALAQALGISQQSVSAIENSETIDDAKLAEVAKALGVSAEAIKNFTEENMINYFNNFYDNSTSTGINGMFNPTHCTFNPLDKVVELYERLVLAEKEKNEYLEKLMKEK
ncbi:MULTISPECIES: helix-turn-helix domain-containing protein [Flavobacterium]|uniref:Helix-turn-helix transcriptional regulator n=1 Tax=Flavobacterium ginsengisoli TaxID=871694 RepID=A0ABP7EWK6_9FLAO|nr:MULTISPECIES: helix-turn-helix transcriptional regulator [Flavobacterium]MBJ2123082.1 helix-turn-helix transcriptional regulator [Flavobacterium sp. IB48]